MIALRTASRACSLRLWSAMAADATRRRWPWLDRGEIVHQRFKRCSALPRVIAGGVSPLPVAGMYWRGRMSESRDGPSAISAPNRRRRFAEVDVGRAVLLGDEVLVTGGEAGRHSGWACVNVLTEMIAGCACSRDRTTRSALDRQPKLSPRLPTPARHFTGIILPVGTCQTFIPNSFSAFRNAIFSLASRGRSTPRNQSV